MSNPTGSIPTGGTDYPKTLILGPGDEIEGQFLRLTRGFTRDGDERIIAVISIDGQERSLWLHELALRGQFQKLKPESGETITVARAREKRVSASGREYWPFKVEAPGRAVEVLDWTHPLLAGDGEAPSGGDDGDDIPF